MKNVALFIVFIFLSLLSYSYEVREYVASKQGVTIFTTGPWSDTIAYQRSLDRYLDFLLKKIDRKNNALKIYINLSNYDIGRAKSNPHREFIFVSYDTILKCDTVFFIPSEAENYQAIYKLPASQNWVLSYPPDGIKGIKGIYANSVGLKIIYLGFDSTYYDRILSITNYALRNLSLIAKQQEYIRIQSNYFGMNISLLTFDTSKLNSIKTKNYDFHYDETFLNQYKFQIIGVVAFLSFLLILYLRRQKKHQA